MSKPATRSSLKISVDTNILYSALYYPGNERLLIEACASNLLEAYITEYILLELQGVLARRGLDKQLVLDYVLENKIRVLEDDFWRKHVSYRRYARLTKKLTGVGDRPVFTFAAVFTEVHENSFFVSGDKGFMGNPVVRKTLKNRIKTTREILELI